MSVENSPPTAEPGTISSEMPWQVQRIADGEVITVHRTERAAVRAAAELGEGYTVRQAGPGRPRKDAERRTATFLLRMTPTRKARYEAAAEAEGLSLADWITAACDAYAGEE